MKKSLLATVIAVTIATGPSHTQQTTTKDQLIGSWKVLNLKATTGDKVTYPLGEQVAGYVTITSTRFWLFVRGCDPKSTRNMTAEQTAEGIKLTAHVDAASSQAIFDTDRVYFIRVDGNKMIVKGTVIVPMTGQKSIVEFELVKSD
jgi:hypothetical protein